MVLPRYTTSCVILGKTGSSIIYHLSVRSTYIASSIQIAHAAAYFGNDLSATYRACLQYN